jgi:hypothetical protein
VAPTPKTQQRNNHNEFGARANQRLDCRWPRSPCYREGQAFTRVHLPFILFEEKSVMSRPFEPRFPQEVIDRYVVGLESAKQIGFDFGYLQPAAIKKFLLKAGVKLRTPEEEREIEIQRRTK